MTDTTALRASAPVTLHSIAVSPIEYRGQRVLTFAQIDQIHGRTEGTAKRNFTENRERLIEGEDYFQITADEIRTQSLSDVFPPRTPKGTLVTESGYLLLVKSFTDDLAWQVQKQLVKVYFRAREAAAAPSYEKISAKQLQELSQAASKAISHAYGLINAEGVQHLYSRLRVDHRIQHLADLPAADFDRALHTIHQIGDMNQAFYRWFEQLRDAYLREHVRNGHPFSNWIKREWNKQMKTALPERPDWTAIAQQLGLPVVAVE